MAKIPTLFYINKRRRRLPPRPEGRGFRRLISMKIGLYPIIVECMEEGGYYAGCPSIQGCHVEGETYIEAIENLTDAIQIIIDSYQELRKLLPDVI